MESIILPAQEAIADRNSASDLRATFNLSSSFSVRKWLVKLADC